LTICYEALRQNAEHAEMSEHAENLIMHYSAFRDFRHFHVFRVFSIVMDEPHGRTALKTFLEKLIEWQKE
jgi:hypothetical protein